MRESNAEPEPTRPAQPLATPPPEREVSLWRLVIGACVSTGLLLAGLVGAADAGLLPAPLVNTITGGNAAPATTNPETTLAGADPIQSTQCAFVSASPGAVCNLVFLDSRGHLVIPSLGIPVPSRWLAEQHDPTAEDNAAVIAALIRTPYAPPGRGMAAYPVSVLPAFAATLQTAGVTPAQLLAWLYTNVPATERPLWARG